jgi:hypothetical protein
MRGRSPDSPGGRWFGGRVAHATVIAYLALFVALAGGTAYAAKHYLITSTKQIKPSVRKALHGSTGPTGPSGPGGATGPSGPLLTVLPSGKTETGVFDAEGTASGVGDLASASISFSIPLASAPTPTLVSSGTSASCPGSVAAPAAAPGQLCLYIGSQVNVAVVGGADDAATTDPISGDAASASPYGAGLFVNSAAAGNFYLMGTWAVTAP